MGLFRQNGLRAFRPILDWGNEVDDPMADFLDRSSIGLIEDRKKEEQDDEMNEKGIEQRARVSPPARSRALKEFWGGVSGKRKRDVSHGEGGVAFP